MINTFDNYLSSEQAISIEQMEQIYKDMAEEISTDQAALKLYEKLIETATDYAEIRAKWALMSREEKRGNDPLRTSCHDSVIIHFNMLERYLKKQGKPAQWRDILGYEEKNSANRKRIGDFACYIVFLNSLNAR